MTTNLRLWGSLALWVPLALLGACASADKAKPAVKPPSLIQAPGRAAVVVSDRDDGASVVLDATQELRVELSNSAWEVANNFDWSVVDLKPGVLNVLGARFERSGRDSNPTESDGATVWRIRPQAPGRVTLSFGLRRPHSIGPAKRTVSFDVTVK